MKSVIVGCGDVGRRIARCLIADGQPTSEIGAFVRSKDSASECVKIGLTAVQLDLDENVIESVNSCHDAKVYYTIAPQKFGIEDERSKALLARWVDLEVKPCKVVLISTTGVYGDCAGAWVTEESPTCPATERGQRRLDSEAQWLQWGSDHAVPVTILRVPGIYAFSRLPRERLRKRVPVVRAQECGFTNRIHADDLANVCVVAMRNGLAGEVYNATDGTPGKITEYLQEASKVLGMERLPEISMAQARLELSAGMLSYLGESRKISNQKMLEQLKVKLRYPDFREGILI